MQTMQISQVKPAKLNKKKTVSEKITNNIKTLYPVSTVLLITQTNKQILRN